MVNFILCLTLLAFCGFAVYEMLIPPRSHGQTLLCIDLKKRSQLDAFILIGLVGILLYQTGLQISPFTLFLLGMMVIFSLYLAFFRQPRLLFKKTGFYLNTIFVDYQKIDEIKFSEDHYILFYLTNGKRLTALLNTSDDQAHILQFLKGVSK